MGIFTKVLVVFVTIASILLVGLMAAFVKNTATLDDRLASETARRAVAESNAANVEADLEAQSNASGLRVLALTGEVNNLRAQLSERDATIAGLSRQVIELSSANDDVRTQLNSLSTGLEQSTQVTGILNEEVTQRRDRNTQLAQRNIEVNDRNQELSTQVATLNRQVRLLQERIVDLGTINDTLTQQVQNGGAVASSSSSTNAATPSVQPDSLIMGRVTNVDTINGELFVALNVGRNDSVAEGMKFMLYSGEQFLGNAVINLVDDNESSGKVTLRRGEITADAEAVAGAR